MAAKVFHSPRASPNLNISNNPSNGILGMTKEGPPCMNSPHDERIQYHYLTFDTDLPQPVVACPDDHGYGKEVPPRPDLTDYTDPMRWSNSRKRFMTCLSSIVTVTAAYSPGSYTSPANVLTHQWNISHVVYNTGITLFCFGFGIAPMVLAPFSEINGRRPVFVVTGVLFVVCQLCSAVTQSFGGMLAARLFLGIGGSTFSTMVGGILADIWDSSERNTPMTIFTGATLFGTGLGPLVSGFVVQNISWRWVFYIQTITSGILIAAVILFFKETRGSILLSRKAKALNQWYEELESAGFPGVAFPKSGSAGNEKFDQCKRIRWKVKADEERASLAKMVSVSLFRPFYLLCTESVVFWFSAWVSFSWAVLYLQFGAIPLVFSHNHNFDLQQCGAVFAAVCSGGIISTGLSIYQEKLALSYFPHRFSSGVEARLYFACIESPLMPIGLFWFGWTSFASVHWIVPTIGVVVATMGIFSIYLAVFNYLADVYHRYASSALAAQSLCRNLLGGVFPLVTVQLFTAWAPSNLSFATASTLLGGIGLILTVVPWVLVWYGPKIRARSKIASEIRDPSA